MPSLHNIVMNNDLVIIKPDKENSVVILNKMTHFKNALEIS